MLEMANSAQNHLSPARCDDNLSLLQLACPARFGGCVSESPPEAARLVNAAPRYVTQATAVRLSATFSTRVLEKLGQMQASSTADIVARQTDRGLGSGSHALARTEQPQMDPSVRV
jgi:hypothetical protein